MSAEPSILRETSDSGVGAIDENKPRNGSVSNVYTSLFSQAIAQVDANQKIAGSVPAPSAKKALSGVKVTNGLFKSSFTRQPSDGSDDEGGGISASVGHVSGEERDANNAKARWAKATWYATQQAAERTRISAKRTPSFRPDNETPSFRRTGSNDDLPSGKHGMLFKISQMLHSQPVNVVLVLMTVYALFVPEIYFLASESPAGDFVLFTINFVVATMFMIELAVRSLVEKGYLFSYIFWLDLLAIVSFVPDIAWWANEVDLIGLLGSLTIARTGRAARAGARAARIVKALGFLRRWLRRLGKQQDEEELESVHEFGATLEHHISLLLILVVGFMLILSAVLEAVQVSTPPFEMELMALAGAYADGFQMNPSNPAFLSFIESWVEAKGSDGEVLWLEIDGHLMYGSEEAMDKVRRFPDEKMEAEIDSFRDTLSKCRLVVSGREGAVREYLGSLVQVLWVIIVLAFSSCYFSNYLNDQLVLPMERMMHSVEQFAHDPLKPLKERSSVKHRETVILENTLIKFGCLLQIAYGEAGAKVISASLQNDHHAQTGKIVNAFFGFCDIRNFTDLTEVLQADVVKMVNEVAHVVHESVCFNRGAPNKNIGDAFLLVWKPKRNTSASETAESCLRSYIHIIIELTRNKDLLKWAAKPEIQERIPNFKVKLGFGLHFGWAIECAIGSQRKIDASYLSPHVNMASRLESATKMFGVAILISEATYQLFSSEVQKLCRLIDRVTFKGSVRPMSIYTYDVPFIKRDDNGGTLDRDICLEDDDMQHPDFFDLVQPVSSVEYRARFEGTVNKYLGMSDGRGANWTEAKQMLQQLLKEWPEDGAARSLLSFLEENSAAGPSGVPEDWKGYRKLDEK